MIARFTAEALDGPALLAKSPPADPARPALTLAQHAADTETAARRLFDPDTRWGRNLCRFFGVDDPARFLRNLRVAALFHDIGKANEDFQRAVTTHRGLVQSLRHEHLSALILCLPAVRDWLAHNPDLDIDAITAAVLSHHLKASDNPASDHKWCQSRNAPTIDMLLDHADVATILARVRVAADLPPQPALPAAAWSNAPPWANAWQHGDRRARQFRRDLRKDRPRCALTLALKTAVIAADSVASAMVRTDQSIPDWITKVAHADPLTVGALQQSIIGPRCDSVARTRNAPFTFHTFQERAAALGPRALLLAGCGSGKTMAAWRWAQAQLAAHDLGHVVFLYPTRGTATEGFRDYVAWAPEDEAALVHGTAGYELEGMARNPSEAMRGKHIVPDEAERRLFALGLWRRRYFSATVDQFLAFLEHRYDSLCLLPLLADSAVILDEVHSYDRTMFENLVAFLKHFDVPVLCMTATLPPIRRKQLEDAGLRVYPTAADRAELTDLETAETHPRYRVEHVDGESTAMARAVDAYRAGRRVLWVVNTVRRCQELSQDLSKAIGAPVLTYHSRFRESDRRTQHAATVRAFQQRDAPAVAVTTQVCEMSLDLDADVLISELAPVPSLVQRMGRANRHLARGKDFRADVYLYSPPDDAPYSKQDMAAARAFVNALRASGAFGAPGGGTSQRQLAEALERHVPPETRASSDNARFLEGGYFAEPGSFRDVDDYGATCVLDSDLATLEPLSAERDWRELHLPGYLITVPRRHARDDRPAWLPPYIRIAAGDRYSPDRGFLVGDPT